MKPRIDATMAKKTASTPASRKTTTNQPIRPVVRPERFVWGWLEKGQPFLQVLCALLGGRRLSSWLSSGGLSSQFSFSWTTSPTKSPFSWALVHQKQPSERQNPSCDQLGLGDMRGWIAVVGESHPLSHCDVGIVGNHAQSQLTPAVISVEVSVFNLRLFVQSLAELVARTKTQSLVKKIHR